MESAAAKLKRIRAEVARLSNDAYKLFIEELVPALKQSGMELSDYHSLTVDERWDLDRYFHAEVFPLLTRECHSVSGFAKIEPLLAGDLACIPVPKDDDRGNLQSIRLHSQRLPGISRRHVETIAGKSQENENFNVILVGMGRERRDCLRRICELGWASIVIVDSELAEALL